ncbi:MAG: hypothetical protein AAGI23_06985 [Bacteroidota bacterium]
MKQFLFLLSLSLFAACAGDQTDTTTVEGDTTDETSTTASAEAKQATQETLKDLSSYRNDIKEKLDKVIKMKVELLAVDNVPAEAAEGVQAAIRVTEQMENQAENWLTDAALIQSQADTSDISAFQPVLDKSAEAGAYLSKQLDQVERMIKGQLNRVK